MAEGKKQRETLQEGEMFTARVGMKGDGITWGPLLVPCIDTHV